MSTTSTAQAPTARRIGLPDGRRLAMVESGSGSPAVFLETGLGAESAEWQAVQDGIAAFTRVARYDRAGRGESDVPPDPPRTVQHAVEDLRALLHTPGLRDGPCVLVGHSFGGLLVRLHAHLHPRDVAGLVLVDAMHEAQFDRLGPLFPPPAEGDGPALNAMRAFWQHGWRDPAQNAEGLDLPGSLSALSSAQAVSTPLTVLSAGGFLDAKLFGREAGEALQAAWLDLQARLAALGRPVEHVYLRDSGHFVQRDRPEAIVAAVRRMVERLRA